MMVDRETVRVALIAEEAAGARVLRLVDESPSVEIAAVFATPDRRNEKGSVWSTAERMGAPLVPADRVKGPEAAAELADRKVDLVLNVHSLFIVHPTLLELPRLGAYNLHPGPLPEMAGLNVPSWAILLGHDRHGVTLHRMTEGIDEGAIAFEDRFPVAPNATGLTLSVECARRGVALVKRLLETVVLGEPIPALTQDLSLRRYFGRHAPDGGSVDFDQPAHVVAAHVRAADFRPFPSPWGHPTVRGEASEIELAKVSVPAAEKWDAPPPGTVRIQEEQVRVACADGWISLEVVMAEGAVGPPVTVLRDGEILSPLPRTVTIV